MAEPAPELLILSVCPWNHSINMTCDIPPIAPKCEFTYRKQFLRLALEHL